MTLEEKIVLVKEELFKYHPDCPYSVIISLWDDGTDRVRCQYGDDDYVYVATYYNEELTYTKEPILPFLYIENKEGNNFYVVTEEMLAELYPTIDYKE